MPVTQASTDTTFEAVSENPAPALGIASLRFVLIKRALRVRLVWKRKARGSTRIRHEVTALPPSIHLIFARIMLKIRKLVAPNDKKVRGEKLWK